MMERAMLTIDGSMGEGGGQVLRSSLALALLSSTPFRITNIRAGRSRPGLMRQHLMAVNAATVIGDAETSGSEVGATELIFRPKSIRGGTHTFAIGGAGSSTLVFQTILYPLLLGATSTSTITFEGGTHNPMAPPLDFLRRAFLPVLARMGGRVDIAFERYGFYPVGGGRWTASIHPAPSLGRLELLERGAVSACTATALVAQIPASVAMRELEALAALLGWDAAACRPTMIANSPGPGNALLAFVESENVTEVFTAFGERGVSAEDIAKKLAPEVTRYLTAGVPIGEHLADQLVLPMALGCGGVVRTVALTEHCRTQIDLARLFLDTQITVVAEADDVCRIEVRGVTPHPST